MKVEGICALITGAADGIGKAVTERLLEKGAKFVAIVDYDKTKGEQTTQDLTERFGKYRAKFFLCDVSKDDDLKNTFQEAFNVHHHLDVVINNAGVGDGHPAILQINLGAVISGSYLAKQYMSKQHGGKGGVLINTASVAGLTPNPVPRYAATKFGVVGFSLSLAEEDKAFAPADIRVGVVCPSFTPTEMAKKSKFKNRIFLQMTQVVDAFLLLVEDETKHSCCVRITPGKGIDLHPMITFEEFSKELNLFSA